MWRTFAIFFIVESIFDSVFSSSLPKSSSILQYIRKYQINFKSKLFRIQKSDELRFLPSPKKGWLLKLVFYVKKRFNSKNSWLKDIDCMHFVRKVSLNTPKLPRTSHYFSKDPRTSQDFNKNHENSKFKPIFFQTIFIWSEQKV